MKIKILFFGILTDAVETDSMEMENIYSISELKLKLFAKFPKLATHNFQISVNKKIEKGDFLFQHKDEIALLPPFAGG